MEEITHFINGQRVTGTSGRFTDVFNPATGDVQARVVAFGGRTLEGTEPKYLNSPETPLFHKGRMLYGLERLSRTARERPVLVVEGYTDVILPAQAGVDGIVATLGTSLTTDHACLLARYSDQVAVGRKLASVNVASEGSLPLQSLVRNACPQRPRLQGVLELQRASQLCAGFQKVST